MEPERIFVFGHETVFFIEDNSLYCQLNHFFLSPLLDSLTHTIFDIRFDDPPPQTLLQRGGGKKKLTGYMMFAKEMRPKILEENSGLTFGEVGKELGKRWRELSDEDKANYKK